MAASVEDIRSALLATGKFADLEQNTEGANSIAFIGQHTHLRRKVFLKVYDFLEEARSQVLQEPQLLVRATTSEPRCQNLVGVFDADILDVGGNKLLCLQMECIENSSLLRRLQGQGFGQQEAVRITAGILTGVSHLHGLKMLHRDLKPANILLAGDVPKLTDFGSVAVLDSSCASVTASRHSVLYVPPEGWGTPSRYDYTSDLYQVGMVLYELVNGCLVYDGSHYIMPSARRQILLAGRTVEKIPPFELSGMVTHGVCERAKKGKLLSHGAAPRPYMSSRVGKVIRKATHPNPLTRYQSAKEFLGDIARLSLPNWRLTGEGKFEALGWNGWDWRVQDGRGECSQILRSKPGRRNYRRLSPSGTRSLTEAFAFVERRG